MLIDKTDDQALLRMFDVADLLDTNLRKSGAGYTVLGVEMKTCKICEREF